MDNRRIFLANIIGAGTGISLINKIIPASSQEISKYGKPKDTFQKEKDDYFNLKVKNCPLEKFSFISKLDWNMLSLHSEQYIDSIFENDNKPYRYINFPIEIELKLSAFLPLEDKHDRNQI